MCPLHGLEFVDRHLTKLISERTKHADGILDEPLDLGVEGFPEVRAGHQQQRPRSVGPHESEVVGG